MDLCKVIMGDNHPFCGLSRSRRRELYLLLIGLSLSLLYVSLEKITQSGTGTGQDTGVMWVFNSFYDFLMVRRENLWILLECVQFCGQLLTEVLHFIHLLPCFFCFFLPSCVKPGSRSGVSKLSPRGPLSYRV